MMFPIAATFRLACVTLPLLGLSALPTFAQSGVSPQMRAEAMSLMKLCRPDYDRFCNGITPGGGRVLACFQSHAAQLSAPCADALPRAETLKTQADKTGLLPK